MSVLIATSARRTGWALLAFFIGVICMVLSVRSMAPEKFSTLTDEQLVMRLFGLPSLLAVAVLGMVAGCTTLSTSPISRTAAPAPEAVPAGPFLAQVVGLQWLNPLQRRDYPTEWELLWTLGVAKPNKNDDMVKADPKKFSTLQTIGPLVYGDEGQEVFDGFHKKYFLQLMEAFEDIYFSSSDYFYNVHTKEKARWRELAGIHVEYALPEGKLDPVDSEKFVRDYIVSSFDIGNPNSPTLWSRATPPDVHLTMGGANAGFTSLANALDYLQAHPKETVWVMNWDAPTFYTQRKDSQINENMVLLILAGPDFNTERDPLAWIGRPAIRAVGDFAPAEKGDAPRAVQAWTATVDEAARNAGKQGADIAYVIHDADNKHADSATRIGTLAQTLTTERPEFDFMKQTFNTPALLGDMGAGTALTNVALAIGYANHLGKTVLVAGTSDAEHPTAVVITPPTPAQQRPMDPDQDWFRARTENNAYLPWWGLRHDAQYRRQGYSK